MTLLRQTLIIAVGLVLAGAMAVLGVWQLDVYKSQGDDTAVARAAAPPLDLRAAAPAGTAVREGYGRSVRFQGRYDTSLQILVSSGAGAGFRVLTGLVQDDGSVVPVVRGIVPTADGSVPPAPGGRVDELGVLLPSEDDAAGGQSSDTTIDAVRLPVLAQRWSGQLIGGFVTLSPADARAQGMEPATVALPEAKGRLRNGAYAFQWWLFGAFTVTMAIRMARDFGRADDLEAPVSGDVDPVGEPDVGVDETEDTRADDDRAVHERSAGHRAT